MKIWQREQMKEYRVDGKITTITTIQREMQYLQGKKLTNHVENCETHTQTVAFSS